MKPILLASIIVAAACRTSSPAPDETTAWAPVDPFAVVEATLGEGDHVERLHRDGDEFVALVTTGDAFELLRLRWVDETWTIVARQSATEDYLWPEQ